MNVLVACEESQRVCIAFRAKGHNAFSCDILEPSGGHPEYHILGDALILLNPMLYVNPFGDLTCGIQFTTMDGTRHTLPKWDLIIAHPPCTYLTNTGNRWFNVEKYGEKARERLMKRADAVLFFNEFLTADCDRIAIENPVGCISRYKKPTQIIQPYQFGHPVTKKTCLWLKGLNPLVPTKIVEIDRNDVYEYIAANGRIKHDCRSRSSCKPGERSKHRSKTFPGIAQAMAEQWG